MIEGVDLTWSLGRYQSVPPDDRSAGIISETLQEMSENKHIDNPVFVWEVISA